MKSVIVGSLECRFPLWSRRFLRLLPDTTGLGDSVMLIWRTILRKVFGNVERSGSLGVREIGPFVHERPRLVTRFALMRLDDTRRTIPGSASVKTKCDADARGLAGLTIYLCYPPRSNSCLAF